MASGNITTHSLDALPLRVNIQTVERCCRLAATPKQTPSRKDDTLRSDETRASPQPTTNRFTLHLFLPDATILTLGKRPARHLETAQFA